MTTKLTPEIQKITDERFRHDTLLSVATTFDNIPYVRIVNSYYENGSFYTITYALSNKMKHIKMNSTIAVCEEWFTAHGIGKDLGWILKESNSQITEKLRKVFASWYGNGHINEDDKNTCILRINLTDGVLLNKGKKYNIDFEGDNK